MGFILKEHTIGKIIWAEDFEGESFDRDSCTLTLSQAKFSLYGDMLKSKEFRRGYFCFEVRQNIAQRYIDIHPGYFVGVDWLVEGARYLRVDPKVNVTVARYFDKQSDHADVESKEVENLNQEAELAVSHIDENAYKQVDFLRMLLDAMSDDKVAIHCTDLVRIDWDAKPILIQQKDDHLTPFLVVQFLQLLRQIVRKGLKKSYYKVREPLTNRIKGKILVGHHIKLNVFKNRLTKTYCEYQVFGEDNPENRFLKKVLCFASSYVENNAALFLGNHTQIAHLINYARPVFEQISDCNNDERLRHFKHNPFFKEYKEAICIGQHILKRFAYNINHTVAKQIEIPPFWIDMPRLFELYVYQKLLQANEYDTGKIKYQFTTYGNALDILIKDGDDSMIIDTKYKLHYQHSHVHSDIRQVAGYARLHRVREALGITGDNDWHVPCLIIYPDMGKKLPEKQNFEIHKLLGEDRAIKAYHKIYKLGVGLPKV